MLRTHRRSITRFLKYMSVGVSTLSFDLLLLVVLTEFLHVPYYLATPSAFLVAVTINYVVSRKHVFAGTERGLRTGYAYFIVFALIGSAVTTLGVTLLVTYAHLYYLVARVVVAGFVGIGTYLSNLFFNFKVAGKHST